MEESEDIGIFRSPDIRGFPFGQIFMNADTGGIFIRDGLGR